MNGFYTITIKHFGTRYTNLDNQIIVPYLSNEQFFNIIWMLKNSKTVSQFIVSDGQYICKPREHFGFGEIEKWVEKFTYFGDE